MFTNNYMGSVSRHICLVLAIAASVLATDSASAQPIVSAPPDMRTGVYRGRVVTYEIIDGLAVWDGDIILGTPEELEPSGVFAVLGKALDTRQKALVAVSSKERLWPGGIVPYVIDPELSNPNDVLEAIQHWNENTVIRLVERTDQPNWVRFVSTDSGPCRAHLGMIGGEQKVFLREFCGARTVIHEIGHAVGLWHEHQRNDRDTHVWISSDPFNPRRSAYEQKGGRALDSGPYDYSSIMHYGGGSGYIKTIPPSIVLGSGVLSAGDIDGVSRLYGKIPTETTITTNPAGLMIVDGETYAAPHSFDWPPGTSHVIGVVSPQKHWGDDYMIRYLFAKWSDGGAQSHSVTASSETTVFIANFIFQVRPEARVHPPQGGTVRFDPPSDDGFYPFLSFFKIFAEPAEGFSFERWPGWFPGHGPASNPALDRVRRGWNNTAVFTRQTLTTIDTNVPGSVVTVDGRKASLPRNFAWEVGSTHTLRLLGREDTGHDGVIQPYFGFDGERLLFDGWSDGGAAAHDITVSGEPGAITANFTRQVLLDTVTVFDGRARPGTVAVEPGESEGGYYDLSSSVQLTAQPAPGFEFVSWLGDLSGSENPKSLLMDSRKWVRASFIDLQSFESDRIISSEPVEWLFGPGSDRSRGYNGYWVNVPTGATQLAIHLVTATQGTDVDLYANRGHRPSGPSRILGESNEEIAGYASQYLSTGPGGNESITITPESSPPLGPGLYFIAINVRTAGVRVKGTLTAEVNVSESAISATVPVFGFPASLFTTSEGANPPPQALEIRNSGGGTLDYQITTDQSWLFVSPDQGSSVGETDTVEIAVDPSNLEPGAFEGAITITAPPAWPITVPVTLIVIQGRFALDFAYFANGGGITSDLVFVNVAAQPIRPALYFYDKRGSLIAAQSVVEVTGNLEVREDGGLTVQTEMMMEPLGELTISTHGQGEVVSGSVKVVSNGPIGGVLRFDLPGIGVAGVGASPPVRDALFPARRQGGLSTAAAIHNPGEEAMGVRCRLMQGGIVLEEMEISLAAYGQEAQFIEEMFTTTDTSNFVGLVRCTGPGRFTGVAVELDAASRIFTTLPVVPVNRTAGGDKEAVLDFAHFANGGGITSDLVFVNVAIHPIRPALYFYDKEGNPIAAQSVVEVTRNLEVREDGGLTVQTEMMEPLGELTISTHGQGEVVSGSVKVVSDGPIGGVLRFDLPNIGVAGVGASQPVRDAIFPARRQAGGINTAAAIHNPGEEAMGVNCRLMKEGAVLEEVKIPLEANGQEARFIDEVFTTTDTSDFVGLVRCTAPEGRLFTGVAVELDAANRIFTTLPVVPVPERTSRE